MIRKLLFICALALASPGLSQVVTNAGQATVGVACTDAGGNASTCYVPAQVPISPSGVPLAAGAQFWNEYVGSGTLLAANQSVFTPTRDAGPYVNVPTTWGFFNAWCTTAVVGSMYVQSSVDNVSWNTAQTIGCAAGTPTYIRVPVMSRYYRVNYINGASVQTGYFNLAVSFSRN